MASLTRRGLRTLLGAVLALGCAVQAPDAARAQPAWPVRTVSIIVPYSAGGATDILARKVAEGLSVALGKTVVVDNRPGAGGTLGTALAANAKPDGYTLFLGQVSSHGIAPNLYTELRYDPVKSFVPIVSIETIPNIVVVNKALPVNSIDELIAYAKAHPDALNFASSGTGASTHLSGEMFKAMTGVTMTHVPFHGSAQALVSVMGGQTQMIFDNMPSAYPYVTAGNLKALAVTTLKRSPQAPDIPTLAEAARSADLSRYDVSAWFGLFAPANTPRPIVDRVNAAVNAMLKEPGFAKFIVENGGVPEGGTPEDLGRHVETELQKWKTVIEQAGVPKQ